LNPFISNVVNIELDVINGRRDIAEVAPEEIYQWIKQRQTKKEEDLAYCLLGLLRVYLVPLYGEVENAWSRLEQEVSNKQKRPCSLPTPVFSTSGRLQKQREDLARTIMWRRAELLNRVRLERTRQEEQRVYQELLE
jgi:ATP/maltotriose-dependent transcriptional regulator MalT